MRAKLIVNDVHLGVQRCAGTTPTTAKKLCAWLEEQLRALIFKHLDKDLYINGDLFDAFEVLLQWAFGFYILASEWLDQSLLIAISKGEPTKAARSPRLFLIRGNHDIAKDNSKQSIFDFIAALLHSRYPDRVVIVDKPMRTDAGVYVIPHLTNQEIFNLELEKALDEPPSYILLHANFDNKFATRSDHSLNVSDEQQCALVNKGHTLIFGHEHQSRNPRPGVWITGNQWPSSIADCLNNSGDSKCCIVLDPVYTPGGDFSVIETWKAAGSFAQVDWREVEGFDHTGLQFIRVTGNATAEEAAKALQVVSKLRQKSEAFVVTNGVKIEGIQDMAELAVEAEQMKAVDVLTYLFEQLEPAQVEVVKKLLAAQGSE